MEGFNIEDAEFALEQEEKSEQFNSAINELTEVRKELESLKGESPVPVRTFSLDLTQEESFETLARILSEEKPDIRLLVNAAGFGKFGSFEKIPLEDEMKMVDLNCKALVKMTKMSLPYMHEGSKIINIASMYGLVGNKVAPASPYHAAKGGVVNLTRALAAESGCACCGWCSCVGSAVVLCCAGCGLRGEGERVD